MVPIGFRIPLAGRGLGIGGFVERATFIETDDEDGPDLADRVLRQEGVLAGFNLGGSAEVQPLPSWTTSKTSRTASAVEDAIDDVVVP